MNILPPLAITTAISLAQVGGQPVFNAAPRNLTVEAQFAAGTGGTTVDAYLQTSFDGGLSWVDICNFHFATSSANALFNLCASTPVTAVRTPTSGTIASNTAVDGALGARYRVQVKSAGTYAGASLRIDLVTDQQA